MTSTCIPQLQSSDSSFDNPLTVQPWRVLVDNLCQNMDPMVYNQLLFFSKDQLKDEDYQRLSSSDEPERYVKYFSTLEDCLGESGVVEHLEHSIRLTNFHGGFGEVDYKEWIKAYKDAKVEYLSRCAERGISLDANFIGRELVLEDVLKYLKQEYKGVVLCGISGMGKTSLANQVCSRLVYCKPQWNVINVNQREKYQLNELLLDLIYGLNTELCIDDQMQYKVVNDIKDLKIQCFRLLTELVQKQQKIVIFLDNADGHCETTYKQQEFCQVLKEMLSRIPPDSEVKLLVTICKKLSNIKHISNEKNLMFDKQMVEQELKPLTASDSVRVLRKLSHKSEKELLETVCHDIHSLCGGIPFSISMVGDLIKNGYQPETLVSVLQSQPQSLAKEDVILQKSFQMMEDSDKMHDLKRLLVRLSVFQTTSFNINAAVSVGTTDGKLQRSTSMSSGMSFKDTSAKDLIWIKLQQLKSHFLLEVDGALSFLGRKKKSTEKSYSLHPLVLRHIYSLCKNDQTLRVEQESAKEQFLNFFGAEIEKLGENSDKQPLIAGNIMETNMVHIKEYFRHIRMEKLLLTKYLPQKDPNKHKASKAVQRRRIWKIADLTIPSDEKKLFARRQAELEKEEKNLFGYIYWRAMEAECLLSQDRIELAAQVFDSLSNELGIVTDDIVCSKANDWKKPVDETIPAWATFYKVMGHLYFLRSRDNNEKSMHERTLEILIVAEKLLAGKDEGTKAVYSRKYFRSDQADVKNLQGCVYFLMKNFDRAEQCHREAYIITVKLTGNQHHRSLTEYQTNMAACLHQKALDTADAAEKNRLFHEALKLYDQSIAINKRIKCETMPCHAGALRNRAEIYYIQEQLEKALADAKEVLKIVRDLYSPPHIEITLAVERIAHYHIKIGKKKQKEMDAEGQDHLEKAITYYDEALTYICNGGLPIENNDARTYRHIRENHLKTMKLLRYDSHLINDRLKQYQAFDEGKLNKRIQQNRQQDLDFVPDEFIKDAMAKGLKFTLQSVDDSDSESSETSSSESSEPTSSSSSSSRSDSPQHKMEVEDVLKIKRRDSGLEELDMSDEEIHDDKDVNDNGPRNNLQHGEHELDESMDSGEASLAHSSGDMQVTLMHANGAKKRYTKGKAGMTLTKQSNVDLLDVMESDETRGIEDQSHRQRSSSSLRESWSGSHSSTSLEDQKRRNTSSGVDSETGTQKRPETWSSAGSRDSVFSQVGQTLDLINLGEEIDEENEIPSIKRKRTDDSLQFDDDMN